MMKKAKTYFALALFAGLMTVSATPATEAAAKTVAEQKLPNQLRNGKFDLVTKKGIAADWSIWKKDDSQAKVQIEKKAGVDQSSAAVFSGGNCSYFTWAKVQGGEKVYAKIKTRKIGEGAAVLAMRFQDANRKWLPFTVSKTVAFSESGEWVTVELVVKAPANTKTAVPMFSVKNLESPESKVFLDDVEVYILPASGK